MPVCTVLRRVALLATALAAACASVPPARGACYERHLDLPADVAAAIAAGAIRHLLPFADPVPQAAGAPATCGDDGEFHVVYERGGDGAWVPRASHRLTLVCPPDAGTPQVFVRREPALGDLALPGWGAAATTRLQVLVRGDSRGCAVRADLRAPIGADLSQALDRAFALAVDPSASCVGLAEPNLAALASRSTLAQARRLSAIGEPGQAEEQLLRAGHLRALTPSQQHRLGEFAAQSGDLPLARERLGRALLLASDPTTRAQIAGRLQSLATAGLAETARARVASGATSAAERAITAVRLHTARRQHPEPALDYRLASQLHRQDRDELAAFACALLAREHTPLAPLLAADRGEPVRRGLDDFVRQVVHGIEPVAAGSGGDAPASLPAAAPAR